MQVYNISFNDQKYTCRADETLLKALQRQGVSLTFSCGKGSCQVCMLACIDGDLPLQSQSGLRNEYIEQHYFLPCCCQPVSDMQIEEIPRHDLFNRCIVHEKHLLSDTVCQLLLEPSQPAPYHGGQFMNLRRLTDGLSRSYSLASIPDDYFLEFHVRKLSDGNMSNWIYDELQPGDEIDIQGPLGNCCYTQVPSPSSTIILAGSGTGLAPLIGIIREAIQLKHPGQILLLQNTPHQHSAYCQDQLEQLDQESSSFTYMSYEGSVQSSVNLLTDNGLDIITSDNTICFVAGSDNYVDSTCQQLIDTGIENAHILADRFSYRDLRTTRTTARLDIGRRSEDRNIITDSQLDIEDTIDPEMWSALEQGKKLKIILDDFYRRVYKDERLSPFFHNSTPQRSSEKQYLFMRQLFTGERVYFGDRPRNAHHWMVISDELFDYREQLMAQCLRDHKLPEHLVHRWIHLDESFRGDIVKSTPVAKVVNGVEFPLDGYETMVIDVGTLCDSCQQPIEAGETVRYHLRLGHTYCSRCMNQVLQETGD